MDLFPEIITRLDALELRLAELEGGTLKTATTQDANTGAMAPLQANTLSAANTPAEGETTAPHV